VEIIIQDKQNRYRIDHDEIREKATRVLEALGSPDGELSVLIVGDTEMADLNKRYLGRTGPTNVISFPMQEGPFGHISPALLGDVVICMDAAIREGVEGRTTTEARFDQLLIHGILHLFGFDHEKEPQEAKTMKAKERELLGFLTENGAPKNAL
jgi:probable rRNA maturation factor